MKMTRVSGLATLLSLGTMLYETCGFNPLLLSLQGRRHHDDGSNFHANFFELHVLRVVKSSSTQTFVANPRTAASELESKASVPNIRTILPTDEIKELQSKAEKLAFDNHDNYALNALLVNVEEKPDPIACTVCNNGLPDDLPPGCLLRIGPNGATVDEGFLDGDGLIHAITIPPKDDKSNEDGIDTNTPMYSCTYVETHGRTLEKKASANGKDIRFKGILGAAPHGCPILSNLFKNGLDFNTLSCQKDTCNTAMAISGNRILALMEQCPPSEIQVHKDGRISTIGSMLNLDGAIENAPITGGNFGAHGRTDPDTGERIHVSYNSNDRPYVKVDTFDKNWKLVSSKGVDIPAPVMVHDSVISSKYVVICDFPLTVRPMRLLQNKFPVEYEPTHGARIGLVPRDTVKGNIEKDTDKTKWFEVASGVTLHLVNAYDTEDGNVVIHGFKFTPKSDRSYKFDYSSSFLHEWVIDLKRNKIVSDKCLNANEIVEFPSIEQSKVSKKCNYTYGLKTTSIGSPIKQFITPQTGVLLDGIVKFALLDDNENGIMAGDVIGRYMLPRGWHFVSEPTVVEKVGTKEGHYVLLMATEVPEEGRCDDHVKFVLDHNNSLKSQMMVFDGDNISDGPVSLVDVPSQEAHINYGLHSLFVGWDVMI